MGKEPKVFLGDNYYRIQRRRQSQHLFAGAHLIDRSFKGQAASNLAQGVVIHFPSDEEHP